MMNDDEIDAVIAQHLQPEANDIHYSRRFACAIISAVLAKLTAGVEVPEQSRSFLCTKCGSHECEEGTITKDYPPCAKCGYLGFAASNGHTDEALLAYGASQRLAGQQWLPIESAPKDGTTVILG